MSTKRYMQTATHTPLIKGPSGRYLCRWCKTECAKPRQTFCSELCIFEWKIRTSGSFLRGAVFIRDKGVCAKCGEDTEALKDQLSRLKSVDEKAWVLRCESLKIPESRRSSSLWDADHLVSVVEGGGESGLMNVQTLCLACHREKTKELNSRRKSK